MIDKVRRCGECDAFPRATRRQGRTVFMCPVHGTGPVEMLQVRDVTEARMAYEQAQVLKEKAV